MNENPVEEWRVQGVGCRDQHSGASSLESERGEEPLVLAGRVLLLKDLFDVLLCVQALGLLFEGLGRDGALEGLELEGVTCRHDVVVVDGLGVGWKEEEGSIVGKQRAVGWGLSSVPGISPCSSVPWSVTLARCTLLVCLLPFLTADDSQPALPSGAHAERK